MIKINVVIRFESGIMSNMSCLEVVEGSEILAFGADARKFTKSLNNNSEPPCRDVPQAYGWLIRRPPAL
jgi:hypothetical protein